MGVAIMMTPGPAGRNFGKQINITPGWRSRAATIIRDRFGPSPCVIVDNCNDVELLRTLADGERLHVSDAENFWKKVADAVEEHGAVTIVMEY